MEFDQKKALYQLSSIYIMLQILLLLCATVQAHQVHQKYASMHSAFSSFLTKSEEALWMSLDQGGHSPGSKYQKLVDKNINLHRSHLDDIFGVEAANKAHATILMEEKSGNVPSKTHSEYIFDLHEHVQDSREHFDQHTKNLKNFLATKTNTAQQPMISSLVDLGEHGTKSLNTATLHPIVKGVLVGWKNFKAGVVKAGKMFFNMRRFNLFLA